MNKKKVSFFLSSWIRLIAVSYIYIYGHRPLQGLPFLILEGGDAIEIFTTK